MKKGLVFILLLQAAVLTSDAWAIRPHAKTPGGLPKRTLDENDLNLSPAGSVWGSGVVSEPTQPLAKGPMPQMAKVKDKPSAAWKRFEAKHGKGRTAKWNKVTGTPAFVTGKPLSLPLPGKLSKN